MTKEEIVDNIARLNSQTWRDREEVRMEIGKLLAELKKALEQQPTSEDCVSIAELKKWLDVNFSFGGALRKLEMFDRIDKELPPVTPTRKSGLRWIERFDNEDKRLECPHCHKDSDNSYAYCPNCGASFKEEKRGNENGVN